MFSYSIPCENGLEPSLLYLMSTCEADGNLSESLLVSVSHKSRGSQSVLCHMLPLPLSDTLLRTFSVCLKPSIIVFRQWNERLPSVHLFFFPFFLAVFHFSKTFIYLNNEPDAITFIGFAPL